MMLSLKPTLQRTLQSSLTAATILSAISLSATTTTVAFSAPNPKTITPKIRVIPNDRLFTSEPEPVWFGNAPNPKDDPAWSNGNWLKSRFHFSFAEHMDGRNSNFGVLRVMNDDLVQPKRGFGAHGHANMEIITYIVEGSLTHQDSMGTKESLGRGAIQFMTAGTGVRHSEYNLGERPLRFIQTWILPREGNLAPKYGSCSGNDASESKNKMQHLVSDVKSDVTTPVEVNQDLDGYACELDLGEKVSLDLDDDRMGYLLCIEGGVKVNGEQLNKFDACEITGSGGRLEIEATDVEDTENGKVAHVLVFTMKSVPNSGRSDF